MPAREKGKAIYKLLCNYLCEIRDGPLEKLWGRGGGVLAEGEFSSRKNFFFVIKFLVFLFFRPTHEYFLGLIGVHEFFSFNFRLREYFFCTSPAPPP